MLHEVAKPETSHETPQIDEPPETRPRYSLVHDLIATARMYLDAYLIPSRVWAKVRRTIR